MSIRKRLFFSNIVMILMPIFIFIIYFVLLNLFFGSQIRTFTNTYHHGWQNQPDNQESRLMTEFKKSASNDPAELLNKSYLDTLTNQIKSKNAGIIVRKDIKIVYASPVIKDVANDNLPSFGDEGYNQMAWLGNHQYSIWQHDFFFKDGTKGTVFLLERGGAFFQFARRFFPLIIIGIVLIVVFTNVILSYLVSRSILKPVYQLSKAADKISQGELGFHIESTSKDELGKLVNTFDDMRVKLKESQERREQLELNRKELIANISHDLKTPITSIRGYVEGIKDGVANTKDKYNHYLDTIHTKATYMDRLIDELFLYSKLDLRNEPLQFEPVYFLSFMKDYIDEMKLELAEENVQIVLKDPGTIEATVLLDRDKMIRVMNNIFYNSVKYRDKETCKIQVSVQNEEDKVKVTICDNGPGLSQKELSKIFHRFYRSDLSRNSKTGGSGLGLAIAAQIIELHGGLIWAESVQGQGLCLCYTLPNHEDIR